MITDLLTLLQDYGLIITILIIGIFVAYTIIKNSNKTIREQQKLINSLYTKNEDLIKNFTSHDDDKLKGKFINYAENTNKIDRKSVV